MVPFGRNLSFQPQMYVPQMYVLADFKFLTHKNQSSLPANKQTPFWYLNYILNKRIRIITEHVYSYQIFLKGEVQLKKAYTLFNEF